MKVYPCATEPVKPVVEEFPLTWGDIVREEGIYAERGYPVYRFIVLSCWKADHGNVVLLKWDDNLRSAATETWRDHKFRRLDNARLCMEIKECSPTS